MVDQTRPDKTTNPQAEDSLREQFFSYIFHELRTPLTVIHSYAQILAAKLPGTPEFNSQRRISEQMINQGDEMVDMIEELLEASRIPLGRLNLDLAEINFQEFLENLVERLAETVVASMVDEQVRLRHHRRLRKPGIEMHVVGNRAIGIAQATGIDQEARRQPVGAIPQPEIKARGLNLVMIQRQVQRDHPFGDRCRNSL